jgi:hypothetical protein
MTSTYFRAPLMIGALMIAAACGDKANDDALKKDSTLGRDLALAGQDTSAKPALTDVPKTQPPSTKAKAPVTKAATKTATPAAPPKPANGTVSVGTTFSLVAAAEICTNTNKVGDSFTATLKEPVAGSNGVNIPSGAVVTLAVTGLSRSENVNDPIKMVFAAKTIAYGGHTYDLDAAVTPGFHVDKIKNNAQGATAKKVVGGAAVGAIAGQLLGKNTKSTVIGAAVGAAAGAGAAAATSNYEGCFRNATPLTITLNSALTVPVA